MSITVRHRVNAEPYASREAAQDAVDAFFTDPNRSAVFRLVDLHHFSGEGYFPLLRKAGGESAWLTEVRI